MYLRDLPFRRDYTLKLTGNLLHALMANEASRYTIEINLGRVTCYLCERVVDNLRLRNLIAGIKYWVGTLAADFPSRQKLVPKCDNYLSLNVGGDDVTIMSKSNIDMYLFAFSCYQSEVDCQIVVIIVISNQIYFLDP